jgi:uncharacterized protein YycO
MIQQFIRKCFGFILNPIIILIGKINWKQTHSITDNEKAKIVEMISKNYYIILTRHGNHLSTYAISLGNFFISGKFSRWSHVLMNFENQVSNIDDFVLIEAVGEGTKISTFNDVFNNPDSVCLLKPKSMSIDKWSNLLDKARTEVGKPYDTLFDLADDKKLSCVELVRDILKAEPNYLIDFANFEKMISKRSNLTPQMFYECEDFEIVYEIRH